MRITITEDTVAEDFLSYGVGVQCTAEFLPILLRAARAIMGASGHLDWTGSGDGIAWVHVGDRVGLADKRVGVEVTGLSTGDAVRKLREGSIS